MRGQTPQGEQMPKILTIVTSAYKAEKYLELYFQNILSLEGLDGFQVIVVLNDATPAEKKDRGRIPEQVSRDISARLYPQRGHRGIDKPGLHNGRFSLCRLCRCR